nr:immunoglobulin light chain junction region [Macaca mulatta]MPN83265.1 immunoglobulin light chain junction region [Macaca mulatta]
CLQYNSDPITF